MYEINGTSFHDDTPRDLAEMLDEARQSGRRTRVELTMGDTRTGVPWDERPTRCYVGRSTGGTKIPLEINNSRSTGGPRMLDHCVLEAKFTRDGRTVSHWRHPILERVGTHASEALGG